MPDRVDRTATPVRDELGAFLHTVNSGGIDTQLGQGGIEHGDTTATSMTPVLP